MQRGKIINEGVREYIQQRIAVEDHGYATCCWIWQLSLNRGGYGQGHPPGAARVDQAHRFSYREYVGPIPEGLHLDHLCRVRDCCNPDHLEPVTPRENALRAIPFNSNFWKRRTHCQKGHEFTPENTEANASGERRCRTCKSAWRREHEYPKDRGIRGAPKNPRTHCYRGHELTPDNTKVWACGQRRCRTCDTEWHRQAYLRKKAAAREGQRGSGCDGQPPEQDMLRTHVGSATTR